MSSVCQNCGRGPKIAISRSHSNIATKRWQLPNIQTKRIDGKKTNLCTRCIKTINK